MSLPAALGNAALLASALAAVLSLVPTAQAQDWVQQSGPFGGHVIALDRVPAGAVYALRGDTVFRSSNAGASWTDVGANGSAFTFLCLDVTDTGAIWAGTSTRGVAWSLNGGATWTNDQITIDPHTGLGATIIAIGVDPQGRIFAGSFRSVNQGGSFIPMSISGNAFAFDPVGHALAGTQQGVQRSSDGGNTWTPINAGMTNETVVAVAVDNPSSIWAGTLDGEVWRSTNAGATWTMGGPGLPGDPIRSIEVLPTSVLASAGDDVYRTTDGGASWAPAGMDLGTVNDLLFASGDLWIGSAGLGVFHSTDAGQTATPVSSESMFAPGLSAMATDVAGPLYLGSTGAGVFRSSDGGASWVSTSAGLEHLYATSIATGAPGQAWLASFRGIYATTDTGDTWELLAFEDDRTHGVVARPGDVLIVLADGDGGLAAVHRSTDAGATWTEVWNSPAAFRLDSIETTDAGALLVGGTTFFGGNVLRSTDDGATWSETQVGFSGVEAIGVGSSGLAWAAAGDNVLHRSTDDGVTWSPLPNGGWPTGTIGSLVAIEHGAPGLFLVGTGSIFRSTDDGDTWAPFGDGIPSPNVAMLADTPAGFFAGTYSAGLYRLGGATDVANAGAALDGPSLAIAPNPFRGMTNVSWNLPRAAFVTVDVYDVRGRRVAALSPGFSDAGRGSLAWDGRASSGARVAPGAYFVRWEADGRTAGEKVLHLR